MTGKVRPKASAAETGGSLISDAKLKQLYATMLQCRLFTEHAQKRRSAADSMGQEALTTGWVIDLLQGDTVAPAPRDGIAGLVKGIPLSEMMGSARRKRALPAHNILLEAEPGEQLRAVAAAAAAHKRSKKGHVVVMFAATSTSALACWHEAVKGAAKRRLPIVFVVENNPWTVPKKMQREDDFTQVARGYGLAGITVDGNDVVAVYRVACESLERVRRGDGPALVQGTTYHVIGQRRGERDPLIQMERYLKTKKLFRARWKRQMVEEFSREIAAAGKNLC